MNNEDAYTFLDQSENSANAARKYMDIFKLDESYFNSLKTKFNKLKLARSTYVKNQNIDTWNSLTFESGEAQAMNNPKKRKSNSIDDSIGNITLENLCSTCSCEYVTLCLNCTNGVFAEPNCDKRKNIGELKLESQRSRLNVLLKHIQFVANSEGVDEKEIATLALQLISNVEHDRMVSQVCSVILDTGTFAQPQRQLSIDKSAFLLDSLEIGKRKYKNLRKLCKSEGIIFPSYDKIALFRTEISLSTGIELVQSDGQTIGAGYSYKEIVQHTTERILQTITIHPTRYPLEIEIADGLDGSGSHRIYNQLSDNPNFTTKNFLLFAFKVLSIKDRSSTTIWYNSLPNSPFSTRPITLLAKSENLDTVDFLMKEFINPPTMQLENNGIYLSLGHCCVKIRRTMFDGKMSKLLSGAGGCFLSIMHCHSCSTQRP